MVSDFQICCSAEELSTVPSSYASLAFDSSSKNSVTQFTKEGADKILRRYKYIMQLFCHVFTNTIPRPLASNDALEQLYLCI